MKPYSDFVAETTRTMDDESCLKLAMWHQSEGRHCVCEIVMLLIEYRELKRGIASPEKDRQQDEWCRRFQEAVLDVNRWDSEVRFASLIESTVTPI